MPAKELPPDKDRPNEPSASHSWLAPEARQLEIEPGRPLLHRFCTVCRRNFVNDLVTGEWYAAFPGIFQFERLDDVSNRWIAEECPGNHLESDEEARRIAMSHSQQKRGAPGRGRE
jgi:hypothetical protein